MNKFLDLFDIFKIKYTPVSVLKKYSRLGFASFFIAMAAALIVIGDLATILHLQNNPLVVQNFVVIDPLLTGLTALLAIAGLLMGIVAIVQKKKKRLFAFVGLVVNGLFFLWICSLYAINIITAFRGPGG